MNKFLVINQGSSMVNKRKINAGSKDKYALNLV